MLMGGERSIKIRMRVKKKKKKKKTESVPSIEVDSLLELSQRMWSVDFAEY